MKNGHDDDDQEMRCDDTSLPLLLTSLTSLNIKLIICRKKEELKNLLSKFTYN